jgi:hypothetical protein
MKMSVTTTSKRAVPIALAASLPPGATMTRWPACSKTGKSFSSIATSSSTNRMSLDMAFLL